MPSRTIRLGARQAAVYAAEAEALDGRGIRWRRLGEAQAYADRLVASEWFAERWPRFTRCHVSRRGRGARWSTATAAGPHQGHVLLVQLDQATLLHELAHLLAPPDAGHGDAFVAVQLELIRHEMGFMAWAEYQAALRPSGDRPPGGVDRALRGA